MTQYIAVKGWGLGDITTELKRAAVLFDKVAVRHVHGESDCEQHVHAAREIEWLQEQGVVIPAPDTVADDASHPWLHDYPSTIISDPMCMVRAFILEGISNPKYYGRGQKFIGDIADFKQQYFQTAADVYARVAAATIQEQGDVALPLVTGGLRSHPLVPVKKTDVVALLFDRIPMPGEDTPWEAILDWRSDETARRKFAQLRVWINRTAKASLPVGEMEDEIESHLASYREYMDIQHKKIPRGTLRLFCTAIAKVLEELPKIKISPLVDVFFHAERARVELFESELKAPGRELAYIVAAMNATAAWYDSSPKRSKSETAAKLKRSGRQRHK